ncbi:MAG: response regulator [Scytolyngbya sp. HA4215-MV1]|nr:response regulator [Scytolyngbya sp. HA4215-MV1]
MDLNSASHHVAKPVNPGLSSIGTRLFVAVMMAASIGLGGLGTLFYRELQSVRLLQLTAETDIKVRELDSELRSSESFLKSLVAATSFLHDSSVRSPKAYEQLVLSFMSARPRLITGFGVMQLPHGLIDRQWFGPYIEESQPNRGIPIASHSRFSLVELWQVEQYPKLQYYTNTIQANQYSWSEPYLNTSFPIPLMTFAGPIRDRKGHLIGVMNGDINIKDLNQVHKSVLSNGTYYVLVTQKGTLLSYSPDPIRSSKLENITSIPALKPVWNQIQHEFVQRKSQGFLKSNSTKSYWVYQKVPSSQWVMLQAIPYSAVIQPALRGAISATLIAGIILALVVFWFIRFLNRRLQPILDVCDADLTHEKGVIRPKDEISRLSDAFFSMVDRHNALLQQLQLANSDLMRSNRLKDSFLANMSHELRTPLNVILGMTEGLQEQVFGTLNERQLKVLQTVERSGSHLLELINDILDLAKIESGHVQLDYAPISISHLCQESLGFIKQQAFNKQIQLNVYVPPHLPHLLVDERRIRQVLINLLSNAVKFTPKGGEVSLVVSVEAITKDQDHTVASSFASSVSTLLCFSVTDTGIGIAPEDIKKLFQSFVQIDSSLNRQYMGTGLGLALVKQIVELHGGKVSITSELGVGSCFTIELPYRVPVVLHSAPTSLTTSPSIGLDSPPLDGTQAHTLLILIAEDNEANMQTVSSYLEAKGYHLLLARDAQAAIDLAKMHQPDLILMDIQMPDMDGLEATRRMRLDPALVNTPIVALTALAMADDREKCLAAGANDYLSKPVKLKQLLTVIQHLLTARNSINH